ncbi:chemotaxis protein CheW [Enterovibrio norvegicus FF-454]|uniref:Chemotaxis protein CheW n=1 Tax=Enterovibrio norvegicus FF-454 TaxID=1185651 RepID=A0A1E5C6B0_9GAMM|nr:chemotaxis protein CheW [Enterovibrio norvegicus]OEE61048.1 chemotaxis protein CheW [Enterovibrio norvegicus FF-454]
MKDSRALSSVQALDDYFDALLEDDVLPQSQDTDATSQVVDAVALVPQPAAIEPTDTFSGATLTKEERDLSSVEKLLSQLQLEEGMEVEVELDADVDTLLDVDAEISTDTEVLADTDVKAATDNDVVTDIDVLTNVDTVQDVDVMTDVDVAIDISIEVESAVEADLDVEISTDVALDTVTLSAEPDVVIVVEDIVMAHVEEVVADDIAIEETVDVETNVDVEPEMQEDEDIAPPWQNIASESAFQVLFFESFGVTYAVPLAELGGIHRLEDCNHLIGRPDWYLGLQTERDQQLDVVDTAMWVMPEKITDNNHREGYSYIVILGDSKWGLACNTLLGTESLKGEQVRWREQAGKRPWLAGLVKQKMCALIHVEALIAMLNQGIDANALA